MRHSDKASRMLTTSSSKLRAINIFAFFVGWLFIASMSYKGLTQLWAAHNGTRSPDDIPTAEIATFLVVFVNSAYLCVIVYICVDACFCRAVPAEPVITVRFAQDIRTCTVTTESPGNTPHTPVGKTTWQSFSYGNLMIASAFDEHSSDDQDQLGSDQDQHSIGKTTDPG
jgi:hypothetical protein